MSDPEPLERPPQFGLPTVEDLRYMRRVCELSQREAAEHTGHTRGQISEMERGATRLRVGLARDLLALYRREWPDGETEPPEPPTDDKTDEMPARYQPDPWIDVSTWGDTGSTRAEIGSVPLRDWLGVSPGDRLGIAPKSPTRVVIGPSVPRILGDVEVREGRSTSDRDATLKGTLTNYLDVTPGETLRVHNDDEQLIIERVDA